MDYVTGWYAKALDLFQDPRYAGEFAYVSTNSITQGEPVPPLFRPVFDAGWRIKFAHRSFAWTSEAPGAAAVHCVIIGYYKSRRRSHRETIYDYADLRGKPQPREVLEQINAYLIDGPNVLVETQMNPLSAAPPGILNGSKPADGGNLIVEPDELPNFRDDRIARKYLRPYVGARELINGGDRHCLWLKGANPRDYLKSPIIKARLESVRRFREGSALRSTREAAKTPQLFWWSSHDDVPHLVIPSASSGARLYIPAGRFGPEVISSNANYITEDVDGFAFAVISSGSFMAWQKAVGGRLKSDIRFAKLELSP